MHASAPDLLSPVTPVTFAGVAGMRGPTTGAPDAGLPAGSRAAAEGTGQQAPQRTTASGTLVWAPWRPAEPDAADAGTPAGAAGLRGGGPTSERATSGGLTSGTVTAGELSAMLATHTARPLWGPWYCVGAAVPDLATRLRVVTRWATGHLPAAAVLYGEAAAWVWLGGAPPQLAEARVRKVHRSPGLTEPPVRLREGTPPDHLVARLPGLNVTTPLGTALGLLARPGPAANRPRVRALLELADAWAPTPPPAALRGLSRARCADLAVAWEELVQAFR